MIGISPVALPGGYPGGCTAVLPRLPTAALPRHPPPPRPPPSAEAAEHGGGRVGGGIRKRVAAERGAVGGALYRGGDGGGAGDQIRGVDAKYGGVEEDRYRRRFLSGELVQCA